MITPRFQLSQSGKTFTIVIRAPYCSLKELDVQIDEESFLFYCKPYYLRLKLPGGIEEERNAHSEFNADTGEFTFTYDKKNPEETFQNLEFITQFLSPKLEVYENGRKIEVLSSSTPQEEIIENEHQYGFAQRGGYKFNFINSEFCGIFEVNPHETSLKDRRDLRLKNEETAFNYDHYLADFIECDEIDSLLHEQSPWKQFDSKDIQSSFTSAELDFLKDLPNIQYEISEKQTCYAFNSLLDILFAYCYDQRTTCFDSSCESGWTIVNICASFQWFEAFETPREAIISGFRRTLMFPLYRNFKLCTAVLQDLKDLLALGEVAIIKALIAMYNIFLEGDSARYILNHLFIKDYVIFAQKWDKVKWTKIVDEVLKLKIEKSDLELNLEEIEELTNEGDDEDDLNSKLKGLNLSGTQTGKGELDSDDDQDDQDEDSVDSESDSTDSDDSSASESEESDSE